MVIAPQHRADIKLERIMPGEAGKFFMDKRMKHMRNVKEQADQQMKQQMAQQKIAIEKKKIMMKKQELQKQLQLKTQQLKKQARAGAEQDATR
jgi:septin family protein